MEKYVIVLLVLNNPTELHAKGLFSNERNCWRWTAMVNMSIEHQWMGRCLPYGKFREEFPTLQLDEES